MSSDAVVIGSGPNGFAAAITMAENHFSPLIIEAKDTVGGGMRSQELTLPGFIHDVCSAVHPLACASPFFQSLPLSKHGLEWVYPILSLAHPFDDGSLAFIDRSIDKTAEGLRVDGEVYKDLMEPLVRDWPLLVDDLLAPLRFPKHPLLSFKFATLGLRSAYSFSKRNFKGKQAQGLFGGLAAHAALPLEKAVTAAFGLILGALGHINGWPIAKGGSQKIAEALNFYYSSIGGKVQTGVKIDDLSAIKAPFIFCDVTPRQLLEMGKNLLPGVYSRRLASFRYGPGVFKLDWALKEPIPWKARECLKAGTVHIGGTLEEIAYAERQVWENKHPEKPFIILSQPSLFDKTRAPAGFHTVWGYCHVPNGSNRDMTDQIENQIERFAPGFKDCIIGRSRLTSSDLQRYNPNYIGGDINGGVQDIFQLFTRPVAKIVPYSTPVKGLYLCSSSTPPGGGVHGMCGYHAANYALNNLK